MPDETDGAILARMGIDAAKWTDEFFKINQMRTLLRDCPDQEPLGVNWGTMVGWFANAIEAGRTAGRAESLETHHA
jgi:hypothetical protein